MILDALLSFRGGLCRACCRQRKNRAGEIIAAPNTITTSALAERPAVIRSRSELEERLYGWQEGVESNAIEVLGG